MHKKQHAHGAIEYYAALRSLNAIARCDIAVLVLDAEAGILEQDKKIADHIVENRRACILVVNKWDLFEQQSAAVRRGEGRRFRISSGVGSAASSSRTSAAPSKPD